jgi:hypothetical protein
MTFFLNKSYDLIKRLYWVLVIICTLPKCNENKYDLIYFPIIIHFASDNSNVSISNINLIVKGEQEITYSKSEYVEMLLDSNDFFTCPIDSPSCDRRLYYYQVPEYTNTTLMTKYFRFRRDLPCSINVEITDSNRSIIANGKFNLTSRRAEICDYLIYCSNEYDTNSPKLSNFIKAISRSWMQDHKILKYSIPCQNQVDSIFIVWQSYN